MTAHWIDDHRLLVKGMYGPNVWYTVDVDTQTCTCAAKTFKLAGLCPHLRLANQMAGILGGE